MILGWLLLVVCGVSDLDKEGKKQDGCQISKRGTLVPKLTCERERPVNGYKQCMQASLSLLPASPLLKTDLQLGG